VKIALGPGNRRTTMAALQVMLHYTKPKLGNASWSLAIGVEGVEGWLRAVLGSGASRSC
jgi:hypothetical protein